MQAPSTADDAAWRRTRSAVVRNAIGIGVATGAYAVSFGAIATSTGFSPLEASGLSALMFTGASQFALVAVIAAGGDALSAVVTAILLGSRNSLYALRMAPLLRVRGLRRLAAAQLVIDETIAMAIARDDPRAARLAFYATGISVFVLWNVGTLIGALGARVLPPSEVLGLDAAVPAALLGLLAPRLRGRELWAIALAAAAVALAASTFLAAGVPILLAAGVAVVSGLVRVRRRAASETG